jgi:hypothetical protein
MAVEQIRQFHCKLCDYIKVLGEGEVINTCPSCNDGENKVYILNKKEIEFIKNSDDPGFYSWLITDMGGKVK